MDRNALDWLFSTAPQALAALVGLIFAGVAFIIGAIDKQVKQDDSSEDILLSMKMQIHADMKMLFLLSGVSIISDFFLLALNSIQEGFVFSFEGQFSPYLTLAAIVLVMNVATLIYSLWFIIKVASPDFFSKTVKRLSQLEREGDVEVKEYLVAFIEMEKALRTLSIFYVPKGEKQPSVNEMLKELKYRRLMDARDVDDMFSLTRLRNLIMHGGEIQHVERQMYDKVKKYTKVIALLKNKL
jgi:hypothetical protein